MNRVLCPMLLSPYNPRLIQEGDVYWVSIKYDGWRAIYCNGIFYSRSGNKIDVPPHIKSAVQALNLPDNAVLDGELWLRVRAFDETATAIAQKSTFLRYAVFDKPSAKGGFRSRNQELILDFARAPSNSALILVKHKHVTTISEIDAFYHECINKHHEGIVVRPDQQLYEYGARPLSFMKRKPSRDLEVVVTGHKRSEKAPPNQPDYVSSLVCQFGSEKFCVSFKRQGAPQIGTTVTVTCADLTTRGVPKHARFKGVRHELDNPSTLRPLKPKPKPKSRVIPPKSTSVVENPQATSNPSGASSRLTVGETVNVPNSKGTGFYQVTNHGDHMYCSCPGWRFQKGVSSKERSCKHTRSFA